MKTKLICCVLIVLLFISCKDKVIRTYYDSGVLKTEEFLVNNKDIYSYYKSYYENGILKVEEYRVKEKEYDLYCKLYYENGNLQAEGPVLEDSALTGHWKMYYSDGKLKWEGEYKDGIRVLFKDNIMPDYEELETNLQTPNEIILGKPFSFRIYVESLHPQSYLVTLGLYNKIEYNESDTINYPYTISAEQIQKYYDAGYDTLDVCIHLPIENGNIVVGENAQCFLIPIEKGNVSN